MLVQKYGGSSVATTQKIIKIAKNIKRRLETEGKILVVVSAMGKTTNNLITLCEKITNSPQKRELDALLSSGEQISSSLLAIALNNNKVKAISLNAFQAQINTTGDFNKALVKTINKQKLLSYFKDFDVLVITGFQGTDSKNNLTTLGRGGSDTTAVAIASVLNCDCEIFSDVESVYSVNPELFKKAKKLKVLSYDQMLEMASNGAKVLDARCVEIAKKYNVKIYLGKSLENDHSKGTYIMEKNFIEEVSVLNMSIRDNITKAEIKANFISQVVKNLKNINLNLEMFCYQNNKISFICKKSEQKIIKNALKQQKNNTKLKFFENLCKFTLVGFGFVTHPKITENLTNLMQKNNIDLISLYITETTISFLIKEDEKLKAISLLTKLFKL
ncbi:MAG: aspartate kinase [Clostridia bacterium]|nr:aspartate kinase [Clostridia bacterium]